MPVWKITNLKRLASATDGGATTKQNVVQQIDAEYVDEDVVLHRETVCLSVTDLSSFTEYDSLTEEDCVAWVRAALTETGELDKIETPPTLSSEGGMLDGTPW